MVNVFTRIYNGSLGTCTFESFLYYIDDKYIVDGLMFDHVNWGLSLEQIHNLLIGGIN